MPKLSIGLALAGGGARGIAHIGVLQVLTEHGIIPRCVSGTSAGAIIGAMYAATMDPAWMEQRFRDFLSSREFKNLGTERLARRQVDPESTNPFARRIQDHVVMNLSLLKQFAIPREKLYAALSYLVPAKKFEALKIPLVICAADLAQCELIQYDSGDLIHALCNSASIPGVLEPEFTEDRIIADGGVMCPVPVAMLKNQCDFVIASEISRKKLPPMNEISIYKMMVRAEQVSQMSLAEHQAKMADFILSPDVMGLHWSQFNELEDLLQSGKSEGQSEIQRLLLALKQAQSHQGRLKRKLRQWLKRRVMHEE